jgi:hypothetical protein
MTTSDENDDERLLRSSIMLGVEVLWLRCEFAVDVNDEADAPDDGTVDILRSFPRPLMPLFEFLYKDAKYSHSSLSWAVTGSPSLIVLNLEVR